MRRRVNAAYWACRVKSKRQHSSGGHVAGTRMKQIICRAGGARFLRVCLLGSFFCFWGDGVGRPIEQVGERAAHPVGDRQSTKNSFDSR